MAELTNNTIPDEPISVNPLQNKDRSNFGSVRKGRTILKEGHLQSENFVTGSTGWQIDAEGNAEFNDGTFRGTFNIGGTQVTIDNTEDIQTWLDYIETEGGGTLYLQPGTYTLTADITVPDGVALEGVSRDGVLINCNTSYAVKVTGSDVYTDGTVTINDGGDTVTGALTSWTSAMEGRYIFLDGYWYEITAVNSGTELEISPDYDGVNLAGASYVIATVNFNAVLRKLTIYGATGSGVVISYAYEPWINDLVIYSNGTGLDLDYVQFPRIFVSSTENGVNMNMNYVSGYYVDYCEFSGSTTGNGVTMTYAKDATFFNSSVESNTGDGISLTNCDDTTFLSTDVKYNGGQGIEMVASNNDLAFISVVAEGNTSDGYKLTATTDRTTISSSSIMDNGGYGVNIAAATCDNTQIIAPAFDNNTSGNIYDGGTGTIVLPENKLAYVAGHSLTAGDAVYTADGAETNAEITQANSNANTSSYMNASTDRTGQNFLFPSTALHDRITSVTFRASKSGNPTGNLTLELYAVDGSGFPTGSALTSGTLAYASIGADSDYTITLTAYALTRNTTYVLVWNPGAGVSGANYVDLYFQDGGSQLANATVVTSTDSGSSWSNGGAADSIDSGEDLEFSITCTSTAGYLYKTSAATAEDSDNFIGFALETKSYGQQCKTAINGIVSGLAGITIGAKYYISDTRGQISTSAGTVTRKCGIGASTTSILITNIW